METSFPQFQHRSDIGKVQIAPEVIQVIAGIAANEVEGVLQLNGGFVGGIAEKLGRKNISKGVKVSVGEGHTVIDLSVVMEYGVQIPSVSAQLQHHVAQMVEEITNLEVIEVNIYVVAVQRSQLQ